MMTWLMKFLVNFVWGNSMRKYRETRDLYLFFINLQEIGKKELLI